MKSVIRVYDWALTCGSHARKDYFENGTGTGFDGDPNNVRSDCADLGALLHTANSNGVQLTIKKKEDAEARTLAMSSAAAQLLLKANGADRGRGGKAPAVHSEGAMKRAEMTATGVTIMQPGGAPKGRGGSGRVPGHHRAPMVRSFDRLAALFEQRNALKADELALREREVILLEERARSQRNERADQLLMQSSVPHLPPLQIEANARLSCETPGVGK